jgi:hypothetical protein
MGKGQVSEKELAQGIKSLGGLTGLTSTTVRRDSPFGSEFVKPVVAPVRDALVVEKVKEPLTLDASDARPEPVAKERELFERAETQTPQKTQKPKNTKRIISPDERESDETSARHFTERVTLKMTSEMRDDLHYLATKLQRRKKSKEERITSNTVMRVAIQFLLDELKLKDTDLVNSEEELLLFVKRKLLSK